MRRPFSTGMVGWKNDEPSPGRKYSSFQLKTCTEHLAIGWVENAVVVEWRDKTTVEGAKLVAEYVRSLAADYPGGVLYLAFVSDKAPPPDADARRALAALFRDEAIIGGAVVPEGNALRSAFVRGVLTGLISLGRPKFAISACSNFSQAVRALSDCSKERGTPFNATGFTREVLALRGAVARAPESGVRIVEGAVASAMRGRTGTG
jgi:hypothetical protein